MEKNSLNCVTCGAEMVYLIDLFDEDGDLFGQLYKCQTEGCGMFAINPSVDGDSEEVENE